MIKFLTIGLLSLLSFIPFSTHGMDQKENLISYKKKISQDLSYYQEEIEKKCQGKKNIILDLSDNPYLTSSEVLDLLESINQDSIRSLNLSQTNVKEDLLENIKDLLDKSSFQYLNISGTPVSKKLPHIKGFVTEKIIFIPYALMEKELNIDTNILKKHQEYYNVEEKVTHPKQLSIYQKQQLPSNWEELLYNELNKRTKINQEQFNFIKDSVNNILLYQK